MNIVIISGTNREGSNTFRMAEFYQEKLKSKNVSALVVDLKNLPHDFIFSNTYGNKHPEFQENIQKFVSAADKFIFIIPEYNGGFPGVLKSFIDACKFPESFAGKKCALVGLSSGKFGNLRGLEHFTGVCNYIKMNVLYNKIYIPNIENELTADNTLKTELINKLIDVQIDEFIKF